jgi:hypothetical protein
LVPARFILGNGKFTALPIEPKTNDVILRPVQFDSLDPTDFRPFNRFDSTIYLIGESVLIIDKRAVILLHLFQPKRFLRLGKIDGIAWGALKVVLDPAINPISSEFTYKDRLF